MSNKYKQVVGAVEGLDSDFVELIQQYTKELKDYTDNHDGEFPEWLNKLIEERYGFKPYKL